MANVILYQTGNRSYDPKTKGYYDPWKSHIWLCIEQLRKWNPNIPIHVIVDDHEISGEENFSKLNVRKVNITDLIPDHDVQGSTYFHGDVNPSARACGLRPFYIHALMKRDGLADVFTFDNDVLVYCDLEDVAKTARAVYPKIAVTPYSPTHMVLGMCYIKDAQSLAELNSELWSLMNSDRGRWLLDMDLWGIVSRENSKELIKHFPVWADKQFSDYRRMFRGIFDPNTIGQHLGGCDNGHPPGTFQPHHYICHRIKEGKWSFGKTRDSFGRVFCFVRDEQMGENIKIMSLHIHNKRLWEFM